MSLQAGPQAVNSVVNSALDAAEAASPVEAVETVTRELGMALGATKVSFLIADLSGRGLVRMAHVPLQVSKDPADHTPAALGERLSLIHI